MTQMKFDVRTLGETLRRNQTRDGRAGADRKAENKVSQAHRNPILTRGKIHTKPLDVRPGTWKCPSVTVAPDSSVLREFLNSSVDS